MNEREAEDFLLWRGWDSEALSARECRCSPPSWDSPNGEMCSACEARADDQAEAEWWEALEDERDAAFDALFGPPCSTCGDHGSAGAYICCQQPVADRRGEPTCCGNPVQAPCPECGR